MIKSRRTIGFHSFLKSGFHVIFFIGICLFVIRWTKGAVYLDLYSFLLKPILPGSAQKQWIKEGENIEKTIQLTLLE